jgi:hypothetical protein
MLQHLTERYNKEIRRSEKEKRNKVEIKNRQKG